MVNQTLISFKCDSDNLQELDSLCDSLGVKRNKMLNFLVRYSIDNFKDYPNYLKILSLARCEF